jgi:hypothetical protein
LPLLFSFALVDPSGQLVVPQPLFKSLLVVVSGGAGAILLAFAFKYLTPSLNAGAILGCCWFVINVALDMAILIPMTGMSLVTYVYDIGLRYLLIPITAATMGLVAERPT